VRLTAFPVAAYLRRQRSAKNELAAKIDHNAETAFRVRHDAQRKPLEEFKRAKSFYWLLEKEGLTRPRLPQQGILPERILKPELQKAHSDRVPFGRVTDERQFDCLIRPPDCGDRPDQRDVVRRIGVAGRRQQERVSITFKRRDRCLHLSTEAVDDPLHVREKLSAVAAQTGKLV
jgi:hypothetical protein